MVAFEDKVVVDDTSKNRIVLDDKDALCHWPVSRLHDCLPRLLYAVNSLDTICDILGSRNRRDFHPTNGEVQYD
jgi:hypothetical protein